MMSDERLPWWREFFECTDSLRLAFFPSQEVTAYQVDALRSFLGQWPAPRVLDLCCGHGRHMVPLARQGHRITGIDASQLMVSRAKLAAEAACADCRAVRGDATMLPFAERTFDVTLCLFNSFGYLDTDEADQQVLREVARCLQPGGGFLLDTRNKAFQLSHLPFSEIVPVENGTAVWLECTQDAEGKRLVSVFRSCGTGKVVHRASIRVYTVAELTEMLQAAGLRLVHTYGGYDWSPFRPDSRELLVLAARE